jgi:outer membrane lipoprotein LolB
MALRVEGHEKQSFSAAFELTGAAAQGTLKLFSPLGSTLAHIEWSAGGAMLRTGEDARSFLSLDELLESTTGSPLPVRALFDWFEGIDTALAGWRTDLAAQRLQPAPVLHLRLVLDQSGLGQPKAAP